MENIDLINSLNDEQKAPVLQTEGAVLVTAGAGSGKTRVLTHRIAYLIEKGVDPYNILAITFTNKAASEMRERVERITFDCSQMWVSTFHSMCVRILRSYADTLGYTKNFSIYGEQEKETLIKQILADAQLDEELKKPCIYHISNAKNLNLSCDEYQKEFGFVREIESIVKVYKEYQVQLLKNNAFDFDDLLIKTYALLKNNEEARNKYQERFHYIHIDEFQDTNTVQYDIAKILAGKHGNIMVVGDEDQCIYGWRGANIENILEFKNDFPDVHIYKLEQNYRCTKNIIELANRVIKNNTQRLDKVLYTENNIGEPIELFIGYRDVEESNFVARRIKELVSLGYKYSEIAVLMRYNALSRSIEEGLLSSNIPYKMIGGMKFYDRVEIKNVLAYLRLMVNNSDNASLLRILNFPRRGIGSTTEKQLIEFASAKDVPIAEYLKNYFNELPTQLQKKLQCFRELLISLTEMQGQGTLLEVVKRVIEQTKIIEAYSEKKDTENENRIKNIDDLLSSVDSYSKIYPDDSLSEYLQSVTLLSDADEQDDTTNAVTLATIHAVKGLEYRAVFVVGLEDENFPIIRDGNEDDIEEERRLFYVAVTRAKERLFLSRCQNRYKYGEQKHFAQSRFLDELNGMTNIKVSSFNKSTLDGGLSRYNGSGYGGSYARNNSYNHNDGGYRKIETIYATQDSLNIKSQTASNNSYLFDTAQEKQADGFVVGAKVEHPRFGVGEIVDTSRLATENVITINFEDMGIKNLTFDVSPLTLL